MYNFLKGLKEVLIITSRFIGVVLMFTILLLCILFVSGSYIYKELVDYKNSVLSEVDFENFTYQPSLATQIYSKQGTLLAEIYNENRKYITFDEIPDFVVNALVAVEDRRFYEHTGVDPFGVARAVAVNIQSGGKSQGASTLTQQLTRNLFLTSTKTWERKIKEMILATELENHFDKNKIIEMYLNEMFMGNRAYGIETAAYTYYGKSIREVTKDEATLLVGLFQLPSAYNPLKYPEKALKRRLAVLDSMYREGYLTKEEVDEIKNKPLQLSERTSDSKKVYNMVYPYFTSWVIQQLEKQYGDKIYTAGWKVYTTIDDNAQEIAERVASERAKQYEKTFKAKDIAIVTIDHNTGELVAMAGGADFVRNQINMGAQPRQPGSSMKPLVYTAAIDKGVVTSSSVILDEPININGYAPKNVNRNHSGYMTVRQALIVSNNIAAVKTAHKVGTSNIIEYAEKMGITTLDKKKDVGLSMALGGLTKGISPYEMATAYGVIANRGILVSPHYISRITDQDGNLIYKHETKQNQVLQTDTADQMVNMLMDVIRQGTGSSAQIGRPAAGKTGTTNNNKDLWFVGFTPDVTTAVWVGNSDYSQPTGGFGSSTSAKAWADFMKEYLKGKPVKNFPKILPVTSVKLYLTPDESPKLAGPYCIENSSDSSPEYARPYVVKTLPMESRFIPKETANCENFDDPDYIKNVVEQEGGIDAMIEKGYIQKLAQLGYIKELVDRGYLDTLVRLGYKNKLIEAGYKQILIERGYIEPDNVQPTPEPNPDPINDGGGTGQNDPIPSEPTEPNEPPEQNEPSEPIEPNEPIEENPNDNETPSVEQPDENDSSDNSNGSNAAGKVNKRR